MTESALLALLAVITTPLTVAEPPTVVIGNGILVAVSTVTTAPLKSTLLKSLTVVSVLLTVADVTKVPATLPPATFKTTLLSM